MRRILHIGLGRTGTTFFQFNVLPLIAKIGLIKFLNDRESLIKLQQASYYDLEVDNKNIWGDSIEDIPIIISYEGLIGAPSNWLTNFRFLKKNFDQDVEIIISFREPIDWLRSNYLYAVKDGKVIYEDDYFINNNDERWQFFKKYPVHNFMNIDYINYQELVDLYKSYFKKVFCIPMQKLICPRSFCDVIGILDYSNDELISYVDYNSLIFKNKPKLNVGYSSIAIKFTKYFERILNLLGLSLKKFNSTLYGLEFEKKKRNINKSTLVTQVKILIKNLIKYFLKRLSWKRLWYKYIPSIITLPKYKLPKNLSFHNANIEESKEFFNQLCNRKS